MTTRRVILLGSTGSVGKQAIDVIRHLNALHARGDFPVRFEVVGLAARSRLDTLASQWSEFSSARLAVASDNLGVHGIAGLTRGGAVFTGPDAAERLVREVGCDVVVSAIVGSAGLAATVAAVELGRHVAVANKESLVAAGSILVPSARSSGSCLLPLDSEHSALWQCLDASPGDGVQARPAPPTMVGPGVSRVILTASGGPFRTWSKERIDLATPEEALRHPTWSMGAKVTIDSASLMNKALEVIEAYWLFGVPGDRIEAVIHPQSIVHGMVEYADGSVIAHMAVADMRLPIQHALAWPRRLPGAWPRLDWRGVGRLDFEPPDLDRFPALALARLVIEPRHAQGTSGAILTAANEEAVRAFLEHRIRFGRISELVAGALGSVGSSEVRGLGDVLEAERQAREYVRRSVG
ncbi:MAG: 1-deoxy-D-xylulose-5-phosphate reductoisomerase [Phycisphaeraceae bacterium]|nr:1-deoxy-D-xylulose-5-phosphate reductoisomerase [Phycisphaerae bacterium]MBX3393310.1 1-deoxy-D-xylulose-5-phosphate reductoisomerase [Phycisphaeraceae bacterium]